MILNWQNSELIEQLLQIGEVQENEPECGKEISEDTNQVQNEALEQDLTAPQIIEQDNNVEAPQPEDDSHPVANEDTQAVETATATAECEPNQQVTMDEPSERRKSARLSAAHLKRCLSASQIPSLVKKPSSLHGILIVIDILLTG